MRVLFTKTSSSGNCSVIEATNGELLVIDTGLPYKQIDREIGYKLHKAVGALITHAHKDHAGRINEFTKSGITAYMLEETQNALKITRNFSLFSFGKQFTIKNTFKVVPVEMVHKSTDNTVCPCSGFLISDGVDKMLWCTDTQYIGNKFPPLEYYCIETNYSEKQFEVDDIGYYEKTVERRRLDGHQSVETAILFLKKQDLSKCKAIYLLHISNSLTDKEKRAIKDKVEAEFVGKGVEIYGNV